MFTSPNQPSDTSDGSILHESDWLGTRPFFYNEKTGRSSRSIHEVIDHRNLEFDPDGLRDYLDFGYCAFGHTPVRHVRFVQPCHRLTFNHGKISENRLPDPAESWPTKESKVEDVIQRFLEETHRWEKQSSGDIILPLSGGYDSRMIAWAAGEKNRLRCFSYAIGGKNGSSYETTRARLTCKRLGLHGEEIELGDFHDRMNAWDDIFGISTHAHGMYHLEFFSKIVEQAGTGLPLISGLIGDAWAGSLATLKVSSPDDLPELGLSRGLNAGLVRCTLQADGRHREAYWRLNSHRLKDEKLQLVERMRMKMMLLSYLLIIPEKLGLVPWAPFSIPEIALSMLYLPADQRRKRQWQRELFRQHGLDIEKQAGGTRVNNLDLRALRQKPPVPLNTGLLRELFIPEEIERINRTVFSPSISARAIAWAHSYPKPNRALGLAGVNNPLLQAYAAYLTIKPLESLLRRRNRS